MLRSVSVRLVEAVGVAHQSRSMCCARPESCTFGCLSCRFRGAQVKDLTRRRERADGLVWVSAEPRHSNSDIPTLCETQPLSFYFTLLSILIL